MAEYPINKGIGRPVEFKGLKAQYLFIFCGGLLALFVLFVILYMVGIDQWICIGFGAASSSLLVWQTFALNARYGEHGLMKLGAARSHPRYLINRRRITRLFKRQRKEETTMRNTSKMTTLENKFPLFSGGAWLHHLKGRRHHGGFRGGAAGALHRDGRGVRGDTRLLVQGNQGAAGLLRRSQAGLVYQGTLQAGASEGRHELPFSRSFERHFNERPYLKHTCYLYLTKTTKERSRMQSNFSTLCRGHIIPKELDRETTTKFMEACEQFERIMNDSGLVRLRRLSTDEIVGTEGKAGLVERYFSLMPEGDTTLQDIELSAREMRIGDNRLCLHTLSDAEDLPGKVATDTRYEKLSTDRSDCRLSFASPVGLLLSCNHIYNQYVLIDNSEEALQKFEKSARNMQSLSRYSRSNSINREWIDQYLNEARSYGLTSVRAHFNVMAWSDDAEELKHIRNDVGSQLASMECVPRHNTIDCPTLYWAAIPGNAADFPAEESFHTFIEQAVCLFTEETNYRSSLSPFGIKMVDRLTGKTAAPRHQRPSDEAGYHDQPQQVRAGSFGQRQVVLHEPPRAPIL